MQAESQSGDADGADVKSYKSLAKIVAEHKDVMKLSYQLSSVIASLKSEVNDVITSFSTKYDELWKSVSRVRASCCSLVLSMLAHLDRQCSMMRQSAPRLHCRYLWSHYLTFYLSEYNRKILYILYIII